MCKASDHNPIKAKSPGGGTPGDLIKSLEGLALTPSSFAGVHPCAQQQGSARRVSTGGRRG